MRKVSLVPLDSDLIHLEYEVCGPPPRKTPIYFLFQAPK